MSAPNAATPNAALPPVALESFEGPLDLLLHLIREHKIDIADIPIVQITDHYLAYLRSMEAMNLSVAGEFLVMAATLLEIKSRMLLPKPPKDEVVEGEDGEDPREALVQKLLDYQRYKAFCETLSLWEDERRQVFFRGQADYGDLYELPVGFGELAPKSLVNALARLLADAGVSAENDVTSVRRQKVTLKLAMASLLRKVERGDPEGVVFDECFERPLIRFEIIMTFLALLELLRQLKVVAVQNEMLGEIRVRLYDPERDTPVGDVDLPASEEIADMKKTEVEGDSAGVESSTESEDEAIEEDDEIVG
jgi:segregation and condensation protein A